jgi:hypothetical protein
MTRQQRLMTALLPAIKAVGATNIDLNQPNAKGNKAAPDVFYEAFLFSLVCRALDNLGYSPNCIPVGSTFRFRRAPGKLTSSGSQFSYVEFSTPADTYELHNDTYVDSRSPGAYLELDVMIIPKKHADLRRNLGNPSYRMVRFILEAKDFRSGVGVTTAKSFVGICDRIKYSKCVTALVTSGEMKSMGKKLLDGVASPLGAYGHVSEKKAHQANVANFISDIENELIAIL